MHYYTQLASIHIDAIDTGFLSTLGIGFLSKLYQAIDQCPFSTVIVSQEPDGTVTGFVAGTISTSKMYKWILFRYSHVFIMKLALYAVIPRNMKRIVQTVLYSFSRKSQKCEATYNGSSNAHAAELLSISVDSKYRRKGKGAKLIAELEQWFKSHEIFQYKVVTYSRDPDSIAFYEKKAFVLNDSFYHHGNLLYEYVKKIS